jgi:hypothetical protein
MAGRLAHPNGRLPELSTGLEITLNCMSTLVEAGVDNLWTTRRPSR